MSGHSKWHRIKHQKQATDAKRGQQFTLLATQIKQAALAGTNPETNAALAEAISRAQKANMPLAKINRLLYSPLSSQQESITYEAYGPNGIAMLIATQTDNRRRTVAEIRHILSKYSSSLAETGSVLWKFRPTLIVTINPSPTLNDSLQLALIDAGTTDIKTNSQNTTILSAPENKAAILELLKHHQLKTQKTSQEYTPNQTTKVGPETKKQLTSLLSDLTAHPSVNHVYTDARPSSA
jgi:YebC/PmpR family DNA-binding regulatory protein